MFVDISLKNRISIKQQGWMISLQCLTGQYFLLSLFRRIEIETHCPLKYFIVKKFHQKKISRISRIGPSSAKLNSREKCFSLSFGKLNSRDKKIFSLFAKLNSSIFFRFCQSFSIFSYMITKNIALLVSFQG